VSVSTDGIYFFGLCSDDESLELEEYDNWSWKEQEAFEKEYGVKIGRHCSGDYPMYYLAVTDTKTTAWRGGPQKITPMGISPAWEKTINEAADKIGWPKDDRDIGWWLTSYWG
jgi:hypothetical protein